MVKVYGPAFSLEASGTLADAITFSKWKGRPYIRERVIPANPKSGPQVGMRAMIKFLAQNWTNLTAGQKADWLTRAQTLTASNFNAFCSYNQKRWRNFASPSKLDPATEDDIHGSIADHAAVAGVRQITLSWNVTAVEGLWGIQIFRDTTGDPVSAFSNCIAVVRCESVEVHTYVDTPLAAGTYYYNFRKFTESGLSATPGGSCNATVT